MDLLQHFSHEHQLKLIQIQSEEEAQCSGCEQPVEGPSYCCVDCNFYLHKTCSELAPMIDHPFHRQHPLILLPKPPPYACNCNFCRWHCIGFVYHCSSCEFDLHVRCFLLHQFSSGNPPELQHFGHEHPLILVQNHVDEVNCYCDGCQEPLQGPMYGCYDCRYCLHESCAKLPMEIDDPFHRKHPLKLLAESPYDSGARCDFCNGYVHGFLYHCSSCRFDLHVTCAFHPRFRDGKFPELQHRGHKHPLILIEGHEDEVADSCSWCEYSLSGPIYSCFDCGFHLDKKCFQLPLEITHPFHHQHPLVILDKPRNPFEDTCKLCDSRFQGVLYHCSSCGFNLHIRCALLGELNLDKIVEIQHFSHEMHPMIFIEKHGGEVDQSCQGCMKKLSGPIYSCLDCRFHLHKKCAELPVQINHSSHRKHPLVLCANLPIHQKGCCCHLCKKQKQCKGFVYYCSDCKFGALPEDVSLSRVLAPESHEHEHPFTLVSRPISFICDFCGNDGYGTPYLCLQCDLVVDKDCISFPNAIRILRHDHKIVHIHYLQENKKFEKRECSICHKNVNTEHGSYYCSDCNYIVHVHCATDEFIWDKNAKLDDEDQSSKGAPRSLITCVIEEIKDGENLIATKIQHSYHKHKLSLTCALTDGLLDHEDKSCDCCMKPISVPFYSCGTHPNCDFYLHKHCAELPREKRHPLHRHPLILFKPPANVMSSCKACFRPHHGFIYRCKPCDFYIDIECSLLSDIFKHDSHEHQLFLDHKYEGNCSACSTHIEFQTGAFRCNDCDFSVLDYKCIILPQKAWYKYDPHALVLTYTDDSDPNQRYCDMCEEERNPKHWFYYCKLCDNSVHAECILGEVPHAKLGSEYISWSHPHPLVFVKKIWNLPLCKACGTLCKIQFLQCSLPGCDFTVHWKCKEDIDFESSLHSLFDEVGTLDTASVLGFLLN